MSAIVFQRQIKVANVATNADSTPTIAITRLDTNATVVATTTSGVTNPATGQYSYTLSSPVSGVTYRATWTFIISGRTVTASSGRVLVTDAVGAIIDESDLITFLGSSSLQIMSQQGSSDTDIDAANVQGAINKAEARALSILGNWFANPLTVSGTALKSSASVVAKPLIITACCQYAAFWLNKWRSVQSIDGGGPMSPAEIDQLANAWESEADMDLQKMGRWAQNYSDGLSVDLDLLSTAPRAASANGIAGVQVIAPQCRPAFGYHTQLWGW